MASIAASSQRLIVILDREFGERLRALHQGTPIWIELSPTNAPTVQALWKEHPEPGHLAGITGLPFRPGVGPEDRLLSELDIIDLHHGAYSSPTPYTELEVIGCALRSDVRDALVQMGFDHFEDHELRFLARRTPEQARTRR